MNRTAITRKGFTLIELLVVVLILGILVAVALPSYLSSVNQARLNTTNSNAQTLATAIQAAGVSEGAYPSAGWSTDSNVLANLGQNIPANPCNGDSGATGSAAEWGVAFTVSGTTNQATITPTYVKPSCSTAPTVYTINL